jgi:hypothetical protein
MVADVPYYVQAGLTGQQVALRVDADAGQFVVEADGRAVQCLAIKGLGVGTLSFARFVEHLCAQTHRLGVAPTRPSTYRRIRY